MLNTFCNKSSQVSAALQLWSFDNVDLSWILESNKKFYIALQVFTYKIAPNQIISEILQYSKMTVHCISNLEKQNQVCLFFTIDSLQFMSQSDMQMCKET
jgi:hypothetical protein